MQGNGTKVMNKGSFLWKYFDQMKSGCRNAIMNEHQAVLKFVRNMHLLHLSCPQESSCFSGRELVCCIKHVKARVISSSGWDTHELDMLPT